MTKDKTGTEVSIGPLIDTSRQRYFQEHLYNASREIPLENMTMRTLKSWMMVKGVWDRVATESVSKRPIVWTIGRLTRLYSDYVAGERLFVIADSDKEGKPAEVLKTKIKTILADVRVTLPDSSVKILRQRVQEGTAKADANKQILLETSEWGEVEDKSSKSSVSGKLKIRESEDPQDGLSREIQHELGLTPPQYTILGTPPVHETSLSDAGRGFPGLLTENESFKYQIIMDPSAYKERYTEMADPTYNPDSELYELKKHIFEWVDEVGTPESN